MKKAITILSIVISALTYSQVSIYAPLGTKHFEKSTHYAKNEGGNKGLIMSYRINSKVISGGFLHNSYGDLSFMGAYGYVKDFGQVEISGSIGLISGYKKLYATKKEQMSGMPKIMRDNYIVPLVVVSIRKSIYKNVGIQLLVSPTYVNTGIYFNFK